MTCRSSSGAVRAIFAKYGGNLGETGAVSFIVLRFLFGTPGLFRRLGPRYCDWFRPTFHPWDHDNRAKLADWRREFES